MSIAPVSVLDAAGSALATGSSSGVSPTNSSPSELASAQSSAGEQFSISLAKQREAVRESQAASNVSNDIGSTAARFAETDAQERARIHSMVESGNLDLPTSYTLMVKSHELNLRLQLVGKLASDLSQGIQQLTTRLQ